MDSSGSNDGPIIIHQWGTGTNGLFHQPIDGVCMGWIPSMDPSILLNTNLKYYNYSLIPNHFNLIKNIYLLIKLDSLATPPIPSLYYIFVSHTILCLVTCSSSDCISRNRDFASQPMKVYDTCWCKLLCCSLQWQQIYLLEMMLNILFNPATHLEK